MICGPFEANGNTENASGEGVDPPNAVSAVQTTTAEQRSIRLCRHRKRRRNFLAKTLTGRFREEGRESETWGPMKLAERFPGE